MSKVITTKIGIKVKINDLISYGRKEITTRNQLKKIPTGSLISYMTINGTFKCGGYICKVKKDRFIYVTLDFTQKIRVKFVNIDKMWVGDVFKVIGDVISFKPPDKITNYPVTIGKYTVYYGAILNNSKRFMVSNKYESMVKWYEYFHND